MLIPKTSFELLETVNSKNLDLKLIEQLNKDFQLANIDVLFKLTASIHSLRDDLNKVLLELIQFKFDDYLNLLYRVDVLEKDVVLINDESLESSIDKLVYLILRREYQKVWFKQNYM